MKIRAVVPLMVAAMLTAGATAALAAGNVGGVGGVDSTNSGEPTGSTTTIGGGGSSFASPGGTESGPGLLSDLRALAQSGSTPATGVVVTDAPRAVPRRPTEFGNDALPPPTDLGVRAPRSGN